MKEIYKSIVNEIKAITNLPIYEVTIQHKDNFGDICDTEDYEIPVEEVKDQLTKIIEKLNNGELNNYLEEVLDEDEDVETNTRLFLEYLIDNEILKV